AKTVQAIEPAHLFEDVSQRAPSLVMELIADPRPTVELVVPTGYRGLVNAEVQIQEDAPCSPGQRRFSYELPSSGVVPVVGPRLLRHVSSADCEARCADGSALSQQAKDAEVGFWWLYSDGHHEQFLVGTREEFDAHRKSYEQAGGGRMRSAGGAKG